jgi:hypothetical protein
VTIIAEETIKPIEIGGWKPEGKVRDAVQKLINFLQGFVTFLIYLVLLVLPIMIVIFGPIVLVIWGIVREGEPPKQLVAGGEVFVLKRVERVEKVGDDRYLATFTPNSSGIYYIGSYGVAVNYPLEYRDVGFNPDLPRHIIASGGEVFTEEEAGQSLIAEASLRSQRTVQERISRRDLLLLLALAIFLGEVVLRKVAEIRKRGRSRRPPP